MCEFARFLRIDGTRCYSGGQDYNLRHDWHSLLHDDYPNLRMGLFSRKFFPDADEYLRYIKAFVKRTKLNIKYGHKVLRVVDLESQEESFSDKALSRTHLLQTHKIDTCELLHI